MGVKNKIDWDKIGPPEDIQTDLSTQELLAHLDNKEGDNPESTIQPILSNPFSVFQKYEKKATVRIRISRELYDKLKAAQKQTNSRLSISEFLDILFSKILK